MKRRKFVNSFLGGSFAGVIVAFTYPVIRYLFPLKKTASSVNSVTAAKVGQLAPNASLPFKFGSKPGILINTSEGELRAFIAVCTHLTCTVGYEADTETLLCPCHNGRFDLSGQVLSGPPPAPLESLDVQTAGNEIIVSKKT